MLIQDLVVGQRYYFISYNSANRLQIASGLYVGQACGDDVTLQGKAGTFEIDRRKLETTKRTAQAIARGLPRTRAWLSAM